MHKSTKDAQTRLSRAQPIDLLDFANSYIHKMCVCCEPGLICGLQPQRCAYLIIRSSSWLLFPPSPCLRGGIRSLYPYGGGLVSSQSLPLFGFHWSSLLLTYSIGPSSYLFLTISLRTNPSGLILHPLHSTSSPLLSSHLIPHFQSFRSRFKPGPRGQEFGLVFQTSLLALLW